MKVIIIHGSKSYVSKPKMLKKFMLRFLTKYLGDAPSHSYAWEIAEYLREKGLKAKVFRWNGGIWKKDFNKAANNLAKKLHKEKNKIIIIAKSNGAIIAHIASKKLDNITKIIQIGTPNIPKIIDQKISVVNIYSKNDTPQRNGIILNSLQYFAIGSRTIKGKNIELKNKTHKDLNNKDMFELYYTSIMR